MVVLNVTDCTLKNGLSGNFYVICILLWLGEEKPKETQLFASKTKGPFLSLSFSYPIGPICGKSARSPLLPGSFWNLLLHLHSQAVVQTPVSQLWLPQQELPNL